MNTHEVVILGAGGFGREVYAYAEDCIQDGAQMRVLGFLDNDSSALDAFDLPVGILGPVPQLAEFRSAQFVIAIGDCAIRGRLARQVLSEGLSLQSMVHPTAYVARTAEVLAGTIICPFGFVGVSSRVGANVAINTYASVGHDAQIGADCVLSPYAVVNGGVSLGDQVFLGTHATVTPRVRVGGSTKIGAGAVVMRDVPTGSLALGNPAKSRVMFEIESSP